MCVWPKVLQFVYPLEGTSKAKPDLPCQDLSEMQGPWPLCALFQETDNSSMHLSMCVLISKTQLLQQSGVGESPVPIL